MVYLADSSAWKIVYLNHGKFSLSACFGSSSIIACATSVWLYVICRKNFLDPSSIDKLSFASLMISLHSLHGLNSMTNFTYLFTRYMLGDSTII